MLPLFSRKDDARPARPQHSLKLARAAFALRPHSPTEILLSQRSFEVFALPGGSSDAGPVELRRRDCRVRAGQGRQLGGAGM